MLFAGFTAAKKTIIQNWFTPHMCGKTYWIHSLLQIVTCEYTTAQINGAKPSTIDAWQCFFFNICDHEMVMTCFGMTCFVFSLSFPLSLPFDWTFGILSICLLFCFVVFFFMDVVLWCCVWKEKKNVDNKKKNLSFNHVWIELRHNPLVCLTPWWIAADTPPSPLLTLRRCKLQTSNNVFSVH